MPGVYIFPSDSEKNIKIGIKARTWAVQMHRNRESLIGKARSMCVGDLVMLYVNGEKTLYGLFRVTECPDEARVVSDLWDGKFELPFGIELCKGQKQAGTIFAPSLMRILPSLRGLSGAWSDHITKFRGMTAFQMQQLRRDDIDSLEKEFIWRSERV